MPVAGLAFGGLMRVFHYLARALNALMEIYPVRVSRMFALY